jgi:hypothetical protein
MNGEKPSESMERPLEVLCAVQLGFASLVLALIAIPLRPVVIKPQLLGVVILAIVFGLLFTSFLLIMILRGQNYHPLFYRAPFCLPRDSPDPAKDPDFSPSQADAAIIADDGHNIAVATTRPELVQKR